MIFRKELGKLIFPKESQMKTKPLWQTVWHEGMKKP